MADSTGSSGYSATAHGERHDPAVGRLAQPARRTGHHLYVVVGKRRCLHFHHHPVERRRQSIRAIRCSANTRACWRSSAPAHVDLRTLLSRTSAYDLFVFRYGFRPAAPHVADLFYSLFLHAGLLHLAGNMLFLWIYGDNVEHRLGRLWYLLAYLGTGVAATLFHSVFDSATELPLVGASGAISGVLGFYYLWFPYNRVRLLVVFFPFLVDVIIVPARLVLGMFLIVDNLLPFLATRGTDERRRRIRGAHRRFPRGVADCLGDGAAGAYAGGQPRPNGPMPTRQRTRRPTRFMPRSTRAGSRTRRAPTLRSTRRRRDGSWHPSSPWRLPTGYAAAAATKRRLPCTGGTCATIPTGLAAAAAHLGAGRSCSRRSTSRRRPISTFSKGWSSTLRRTSRRSCGPVSTRWRRGRSSRLVGGDAGVNPNVSIILTQRRRGRREETADGRGKDLFYEPRG